MGSRRSSARNTAASSSQFPPFLTKTYDIVEDPGTDSIISWAADGQSFVVWKPAEFSRDLLPMHFKHNNFSSFVRQLNTYGFRKVDPDRWEFANEYFIKGRRDLLGEIHRRKPATGERSTRAPASHHAHEYAAIEVGQYGGLAQEVDALKRDKNVLLQEVVRLRHAQQTADEELRSLNDRLEMTEQRQQQMLAFFAQALQHPTLVQHFIASSPSIKRIESRRRKKRRPAGASSSGINATVPGAVSSDSEGSEGDMRTNNDAMVVHQPATQGLADLAQAFMGLLNSAPPPKSTYAERRAATAQGPIIEEAAPGSYATSAELAAANAGPLIIGSTPITLGPTAFASGTTAINDGGGHLGGSGMNNNSGNNIMPMDGTAGLTDFVPFDITQGPHHQQQQHAIVEFPGLDSDSLHLSDIDLGDVIPDIMTLPSQDLLINDGGSMQLHENWNSLVHPPAGQAFLHQMEDDADGGTSQQQQQQ